MTGRITPTMIEVRQGDSFTINLHLKKECKEIDLTGWKCEMQVRDKDSGAILISVTGEPVDIEKGKIALNLTPEMTNKAIGDYACDIQVTSDTGEINTIYPSDVNKVGTFRITQQITK
jgi:hypothetical protein